MSAMRMKRDLRRVLRALVKKDIEQKYKRASNGMFVVPASEVLACNRRGSGGLIVRMLRYRASQHIAESLLKILMGDNYVPFREMGPAIRPQWEKKLKETAQSFSILIEKGEDNRFNKKVRTEILLKRRDKAERDTGRPVEFLLPFSPIVFREYLEFDKKNPQYDARITAKELIPVYSDGSVGDPTLYPISGPF